MIQTLPLPLGLDDRDPIALDPNFSPNLRNIRTHRERIERGPGAALFAAAPTTGLDVVTGKFTVPAATGNQTIAHGLGTTPKAIILFTPAIVSASGSFNAREAIGVTDGTTHRSISTFSDNSVATSNTSKSHKAKFLSVVDANEGIRLEGDWVSWNATSFVINWTTVAAFSISNVGFIAIGAAGISAKVLDWNATSGGGNQAITGTGFTPQILFHLHTNQTALATAANGRLAFGVMTVGGEWGVLGESADASSPSASQKSISTTQGINELNLKASLVSMDANGFTINKSASGPTTLITTLALAGLTGVKASSFTKPTTSAPFTQSITGVGFRPATVLLAEINSSGTGLANDLHMMFGFANSSTSQLAYGAKDTNGVSPTVCFSATSSTNIVKLQNVQGVDLRTAQYAGPTADGFDLNWTLNDATTRLYVYVAFGGPANLGVPRNYAQGYLGTIGEKNLLLTDQSAFVYNTATSVFDATAESYAADANKRWGIATTPAGELAWTRLGVNIRKYTGAAFAALITTGTNHSAKQLIAFNDRVISIHTNVGGTVNPRQIRWCISGDASNWSGVGSGILEVIETSQEILTGGFVLGERAFLTKRREIIELIATGTLSPVHRLETRVSGTGMIATHSFALAELTSFFLGADDVVDFDGSSWRSLGSPVYKTLLGLIDFNTVVDTAQGAYRQPDSEYWLLIGTDVFIYDRRRDRWFRDNYSNVAALGIFNVGSSLTLDVDASSFMVAGLQTGETLRIDPTQTTFNGAAIDAYVETRDYLPLQQVRRQMLPTYDRRNALWRVLFRGDPSEIVEVGASADAGTTWETQIVTVNGQGVGLAFFNLAFDTIRVRLRSQAASAFTVRGPIQIETTEAGVVLPP